MPAVSTTNAAARIEFDNWLTNPSSADPIKQVAQVMVMMSVAQGKVLARMKDEVTKATDKITLLNDLLKQLNELSGNFKPATSTITDNVNWTAGDPNKKNYPSGTEVITVGGYEAEGDYSAADLKSKLMEAGVDFRTLSVELFVPVQASTGNTVNFRSITFSKEDLDKIQKNLQIDIERLNSSNQQSQLGLQTQAGRLSASLDYASSTIKKFEGVTDGISANTRA